MARPSPRAAAETLEPRAYLAGITFGAPTSFPVQGISPFEITTADFNRDGTLDVAVVLLLAEEGAPAFGVLLGNRDGTLGSVIPSAPGAVTADVAAADFNGDGKTDVATTAAGPLMLGAGDGNFTSGGGHGLSGLHIAAADFTGDGKPDLAALMNNELTLQAGNGDGTFGPVLSLTLQGRGLALAAGDADGDGAAEVLAADGGHAYVVKAAGGQALSIVDRLDLPESRGPFGLALVAPVAQGRPSLAVPLPDLDQVVVFAPRGDGTFEPGGAAVGTGGGPVQVAAADFDGDGREDLATVNNEDVTVSILARQPDGSFAGHVDFAAGGAPDGIAVVDLNNDERPDLVVVDPANGSVNVIMNTSPGSIAGPGPEPEPGPEPGPDLGPGSGDGPAVLGAAVVGQMPASVIAGRKARAAPAVTVTNDGQSKVSGPVTVTLLLSADETPDAGDATVGAATKRLRLRPGQAKTVRVKVGAFPAVPDGNYFVLAQVSESGGGSAVAAAQSTVAVAAPFVDLSGAFASPALATLKRGERTTVLVNVTNAGNTEARGRVEVTLAVSADAAAGGDDRQVATVTKKVKLKPGGGKTVRIKFAPPEDLAAGNYFLVAGVDAGNAFAERDELNNAPLSAGAFTVE